jgi:hypothetical protein
MTPCPDPDALLSVASVLDWSEDALQHLASCPACRRVRDDLRTARDALALEDAVENGFERRVMDSLPPEPARRERLIGALLLAPVAALTCLAAIVSTAGPSPVEPGPALGLAVFAGLLVSGGSRRRASRHG